MLACLSLFFLGQSLVRATSSRASTSVIAIGSGVDATGATDVSAQMAAFFASVPDGSVVNLAPQGRYRMDQTLVLNGRHSLSINGNGATFFEVTTGDMHRSNVRLQNSSGIYIQNLILRGANPNAGLSDAAYVPTLEHQHGFELLSVSNVALANDTVTDVYGDFVYLSAAPNGPPTNGVMIVGNHFARNGRQAVAMTEARYVYIGANTIGAVRSATFDFEPPDLHGVDHVTIDANNVGTGRQLFVAADGHGFVNDITVSNNVLSAQALQIWAQNLTPGLRNNWKVFGNTSAVTYGSPTGAAMMITNGNGIDIHGNHQPFQPLRNMTLVKVTNPCTVAVVNDVIPGAVGEQTTVGTC